jgi:hypothetical protein
MSTTGRWVPRGQPLYQVPERPDLGTTAMAECTQMTHLLIDANENMINGPLNTALTGPGLLMREGIRSLHPDLPATPTFLRGTREPN